MEPDTAPGGEPAEQFRVVALGSRSIVSDRARDGQLGIVGKSAQQPVDALVGGQATDVENACPLVRGPRPEPAWVGAAVDDPGLAGWGTKGRGRIPRHGQEAVEQPG